MYRLALYGKGGIGKSTTTSNVASALAAAGHTVMQIGCDPKADSTKLLMSGIPVETVLDRLRSGKEVTLRDIVHESTSGVLCIEAGGPVPGVGCAGRGIIAAFDLLSELHAFEVYQPDFVLYDVLGDVVCGGFAMPIRGEYSDAVAIVTSGEMMSLYAADNILRAIDGFRQRGYAPLLGLIANHRAVEEEREKIARFCVEKDVSVLAEIPRSSEIQQAEDRGKTVVEAFPDSALTDRYRALADLIVRESQHG